MAAMSNDNTMASYPMDSDEEVLNTRFELSKMEVGDILSRPFPRTCSALLPRYVGGRHWLLTPFFLSCVCSFLLWVAVTMFVTRLIFCAENYGEASS
jgi:hypothetical protein